MIYYWHIKAGCPSELHRLVESAEKTGWKKHGLPSLESTSPDYDYHVLYVQAMIYGEKEMASKLHNNVLFVLDASGSMSYLRNRVIQEFNSMLGKVRDSAKLEKQSVSVGVTRFNDYTRTVYNFIPNGKELTSDDYYPGGNTALLDAIGEGINLFPGRQLFQSTPANLMIVMTDGVENQSRSWGKERIEELISDKQSQGNWTFVFLCPPGHKNTLAAWGIPKDNIQEWEATEEGTRHVAELTSAGIGTYFEARSSGAMQTNSFYQQVVTNLPSVIDVKKLDDQSLRFTQRTVDKEQEVRDFVEKELGISYVVGSAFFQLTKPEKVQGNKEVLVMEKGKKKVWGGEEARKTIGLPVDGTNAKVTPGNHGNYDIFVQSKSYNRKVVRGTKLLIDTHKKKGDRPTWEPKLA